MSVDLTSNPTGSQQRRDYLDLDAVTYTYEQLQNERDIRIFQIRPGRTGIVVSIQNVPLADACYQALSYVWGSQDRLHEAVVHDSNGCDLGYIPLTTNLNSALHNLRDTEGLEGESFWIDQICIDQEGEEKGAQVGLMSHIYENATRVITYLGPRGPEAEESSGILLMKRLEVHFASNLDIFNSTESIQKGVNSFFIKQLANLPVQVLPSDLQYHGASSNRNHILQGWKWLLQIAYGDWTRRLWMVQEQLLNPNLVMLRGCKMLSWESVAHMTCMFYLKLLPTQYLEMSKERSTRVKDYDYDDIARDVYALWSQRRALQRSENIETYDLFRNMVRYRNLDCSDLRDRIYALLSISSDKDQLGIVPNYNMTSDEVFIDTSIRLLESANRLYLFMSTILSNSTRSPSVPTWVLTLPQDPWDTRRPLQSTTYRPHPEVSLMYKPTISGDRSTLSIKGRIIDSIRTTTQWLQQLPERDRIEESLQIRVRYLLTLGEIMTQVGVSVPSAAVFCRALTTEHKWPSKLGNKEDQMPTLSFHFLSHIRRIFDDLSKDSDVDVRIADSPLSPIWRLTVELYNLLHPLTVLAYQPSEGLSPMEMEAADRLMDHLVVKTRSICITNQGRIGNAMRDVEVGDVVAIFQGSHKPFVLRPTPESNKYKLIGDIYAHGIMYGELYEGLDFHDVDYDIHLV